MNIENCVIVCRDDDDYHQMCIDLDADGIVWASKNKLCWFEDGKYVFYHQNICETHRYRIASGLLYKLIVPDYGDVVINAMANLHMNAKLQQMDWKYYCEQLEEIL